MIHIPNSQIRIFQHSKEDKVLMESFRFSLIRCYMTMKMKMKEEGEDFFMRLLKFDFDVKNVYFRDPHVHHHLIIKCAATSHFTHC